MSGSHPGSLRFDVVVVGGGHAGIEAAWASAQMGAEVALLTFSRESIGRMSCNPAIGGIGKGQIVREIDALGGLMGRAADRAGIQFRMLNRSKGPAVWAPRAQADRHAYPRVVQEFLECQRRITIIEDSVEELKVAVESPVGPDDADFSCPDGGVPAPRGGASRAAGIHPVYRVRGVRTATGRTVRSETVILTTGTFLRGLMHCGSDQSAGGRVGEASAEGLSASLADLGFTLGRLKTGTPPRIHRDSVDYSVCERQAGDEVPIPFSTMTDGLPQRQLDCWVTWTNAAVHRHIVDNLHRAPMYSGQIQSRGPRYCPSLEDKVVRFSDKDRHQVFLEPEGYDNERLYCNGVSTSLPAEVQDAFLREIPGLGKARILQHGYAVEYDFVPTNQSKASLETKLVRGLFLAGQINGTSGYEEAAGQGLMAGINAVQFLRGAEPVVLGRDVAYIGVMIDDLVTRPPVEPYRMFTSRAEYRLQLRADNADERLTPPGRRLGLVDDGRWARFERRRRAAGDVRALLSGRYRDGVPVLTWLRRPEADLSALASHLATVSRDTFCIDALDQVLLDARYDGYVDRQTKQVERFRRLESMVIPESTNYSVIGGLRAEARERLTHVSPRTLGQASRISGITPADVTVLWVNLTARRGRCRSVGGTLDRSDDSEPIGAGG